MLGGSCRSSTDLAEADARWAARSVAQRTGAPNNDPAEEEAERAACREASDPWWKKASLTTVAMSHASATAGSTVAPPTAMARTTKRLVSRRVAQQAGVEWVTTRPSPVTDAAPVVPGAHASTAPPVVLGPPLSSLYPVAGCTGVHVLLRIWRSHCGRRRSGR